ncbi:MAG: hypothetical protein AB7T06_29605 [Kofleriaceae bacterium]
MRKILLVLIIVAACGDNQDVSPRELTRCEQLREHLIDLRLATATNVDQDAHREVMRGALGTSFLDECAGMPEAERECALASTDTAAAAACTQRTAK